MKKQEQKQKQSLLEKGKKISNDLKAGKNISEKDMQKLINKMGEEDLLKLFDYCLYNE